MLLGFFEHLRRYRVPVSIRELLDLLAVMRKGLSFADIDDFYVLCRLTLVKDEKFYDRFDRAFGSYFSGLDQLPATLDLLTPDELAALLAPHVPADARLRELLDEYRLQVRAGSASQHAGAGTGDGEGIPDETETAASNDADKDRVPVESEPGRKDAGDDSGEGEEGHGGEGEGGEQGEGSEGEEGEGDDGREGEGDNGQMGEGVSDIGEEGERTGEVEAPQKVAKKVWLAREFEDYDPDVELGTRNLKLALRRLRRWAREAAELELDLPDTIHATASNGGLLDIKMVPERHNAVKVLLFLDVGGSMDEHVEVCAQLFSAARSEFKYLEYFYFHNFIYESVWRENDRQAQDRLGLVQLLARYPKDYKVIFVGDADMGRHEIVERGGSVEHFNAEPGEASMNRVSDQFRRVIWLNPLPPERWRDSPSIQLVTRLLDGHMYHLSDTGLETAMKVLMR